MSDGWDDPDEEHEPEHERPKAEALPVEATGEIVRTTRRRAGVRPVMARIGTDGRGTFWYRD